VSEGWQAALSRWLAAGLLDESAAGRIREFEAARGAGAGPGRLALLVFGFGGLLLTAGVLLFVAAHWDTLSPGARFALVLAMIAVFHAGGAAAAARGGEALAVTLHAAGTASLGAGIFLSGQIFHVAEHWPAALMLWAIGAAIGTWLLRQWPQVLWLAVLVPAWLWGEWSEALLPRWHWSERAPVTVGTFLLALAYLAAKPAGPAAHWRRVLAWLGAVALIPSAIGLALTNERSWSHFGVESFAVNETLRLVAWVLAVVLPVALAGFLRGRDALWLLPALAWAVVLSWISPETDAGELAMYALLALGAVGVVLWGLRDGQRLAINVGVLGFALAILGFYFANLYDKLGRALGLIGVGVLFLGGGWLLERMRRRLIARVQAGGR
jgi:uncharacterized membrane protein